MNDKKGVVLTAEQLKRRKRRSLAIALVLTALVFLFYVVTIVKLGPGALRKTELPPITVLV
jgi:accessory gene regulator protein AgrB